MLKNSADQFGGVTKTFHWMTALLVIGLLLVGTFMGDITDLALKLKTYNLHKSLGITVLVLTLCRIMWNNISRRPVLTDKIDFWEKPLLGPMHTFFYFLLIAMPLTGWLMSYYGARPVSVFGLPALPALASPDKTTKELFESLHGIIGYTIMAAVGLHIIVALKHHFRDKDIFLKRMLPFVLFLALLLPSSAMADGMTNVRKWNVIHSESSLAFRPKQMGAEFKGTFSLFAADIAFDPDNLAASKVVVNVDISSARTEASDRDEALKGKDWFDVTQFPSAKFETTAFRKTGDKTYEAEATLTIRGISVPITLPFTLDITKRGSEGDRAVVDGTVTLDRSKFQLGIGELADTSVIANEVPVDIHIVAVDANPPDPAAK